MNIRRRMPITPFVTVSIVCIAASTVVFIGCGSDPETAAPGQAEVPKTAEALAVYDGKESFLNRCAVCHGETANGTQSGPPLVNRLYEIGHHPNFSFHNAVNKGVTAHHWNFGDMPSIPNVEPAEIDAIICHVRDLQRSEGIAAGEPC